MPRTIGFSLLELLIVMALLAIFAGLAAPGFQSTLNSREGELLLRTLTTHLSLARTSALEHGAIVTVCPSQDGLTCSGNWNAGHIVFRDGNGDRTVNDDDLLIRSDLRNISGQIQWRAFQNRQYLQID